MHSFYNLPPTDLIPGPQASHQLNPTLHRSGILHGATENARPDIARLVSVFE